MVKKKIRKKIQNFFFQIRLQETKCTLKSLIKMKFFSILLKKPGRNSLSKCPIKMVYFLRHFVSLLRKFFCNNKLSKMCFFKRIWAYILLFEVRNSVGLVMNRSFEWLMPKKKTKILWDISRGYYSQVFWAILKKNIFLLRIWVYILFIVVWFEKKI